jgi:oligopeptide/dipeptide ABC transporter ATP-binding protein
MEGVECLSSIVEVNNLRVHFPIYGGLLYRRIGNVHAVDGVSFAVEPGKTVGIVGESGCGKSTLARTIAGLYPPSAGDLLIDGKSLASVVKGRQLEFYHNIQMIFQDPMDSLNPRLTVRQILEEPLEIHKVTPKGGRLELLTTLLYRVGMQPSALEKFPHEFSGGQRQRIGIARALALKPKLIICDEPVSALDVSVQSQVLNLLMELQRDFGMSLIFIAHDLGVVRHVSDVIHVMYLGKIVESASAEELFANPRHPYTHALLAASFGQFMPKDHLAEWADRVEGEIPSPITPPSGCHFHTRCPLADNKCRQVVPVLAAHQGLDPEHLTACHYSEDSSLRRGQ